MKKTDVVKEEMSEEDKQKLSDRQIVYRCKMLEAQSQEYRRKFDWEWVVRNLYIRGYHFAKYNRASNTVVFSSRTGVRIPINLVSAHMRGVRNQVTSFQPKWEVLPNVTTESAFANARYSGKVLDYVYDKAQIKRKIKEVVNDALWSSIGIWQFDVDSKDNIVISRVDPFDFFVDPNIKSSDLNDPDYGAEYVILTHQVALEAIKNNKDLEHTDELQSDNLIAAAEYKRFLMQVTKNQYSAQKEHNKTKILKQAYLRERQENGEIRIRIVTYVDDFDRPLKNELTDNNEYPFEVFQGDIQPGELYGESWVKHLIPINRVIDALESHIFEYNHFFAKGRFVVDKNSGVRVIVNQHGQIIEKNRGANVTSLPISPLPPSPQQQIDNMRRYLEDISGVHDVSLGRLPGTVRSGVAIAELRQSDATNQADLVDNLEDFLSRAGRKILKLAAENWTTTRLVTVTGLGGKPEYFMAIGEKGAAKKKSFTYGDKKLALAVIGADNEVRVKVGSWLAYTKEARMEKLKEYFRLGVIDQKTFLELSEFADIDGISKRTREERLFQAATGAKSESVGREYGVELDDESLALAENELMNEGIEQHAEVGDNHDIHILIHSEDKENPLIQSHIKEHEEYKKWETHMNSRKLGMQGQVPSAQLAEMISSAVPEGAPPGPETFQMNPAVGPGAPPFQSSVDLIQNPEGV